MRRKQVLGLGLVALGLLLLVGALALATANREESLQAGRASQDALEELQALMATAPTQETEAASLLPAPEVDSEVPSEAATEPEAVPDLTTVALDGHDYVGYLDIPSLDRRLPVMRLAYLEDLQVAPCLQAGSPYTDDAVIAAHNYPSHFGPLRDFTGGEEIRFTDMTGAAIAYTVSVVKTIEPTAVEEVMDSEYDLVLYTCTTGGQARVMLGCERVNAA